MSIPETQKALLLQAPGGAYTVADFPVPQPGPTDVLVKIMAAALNPIDGKILLPAMASMIRSYPFIAGSDGAGVVVQVGAEVKDLKEGDKVLFQGGFDTSAATFQQYAIVPAALTAIIPEDITFDQAASVPSTLVAAALVLYNQSPAPDNLGLRLKPIWEEGGASAYAGTPAFIIGGSSSIGQYAIQLAKLAGHSPIIATASPHNRPLLLSIGATHVLDRSRPAADILAELPSLTGGRPLEYVFCTVTDPDTLRFAVAALAPGGALATVAPGAFRLPEDVANPGDGKRLGYVFGTARLPHTRETGVALFKALDEWLATGAIKPNPVKVLPGGLEGINEGLALIGANRVSGQKLVVHPQETR